MVKGFGDYFKAKRIELGLTLRKFCMMYELDPGNISKMERGKLPPPQSEEKLKEYARMLKIKKGSDDWQTFFDLAAAEAGRVPADLLSDKEVLAKLPALFRTMRGQQVTDEELEELIKMIKGA
jgi:transcriptional regulator with XRE-family HTH domain